MLSLLNLLVIPETSAGKNRIKGKDVVFDGPLCISFTVSFFRQLILQFTC